jgi:hypothetical protein
VKSIKGISVEELAGLVCQTLQDVGITVTLTGGACVAIWSEGRYVSHDLDFIEEGPVPRSKIQRVLSELGFLPQGRHFVHPDTELFIEFPTGPLMVGDQRVERVSERKTRAGILRLLSPTDCVKDRLAAYYHWNDRQSLEQAILVAVSQRIVQAEVQRWSQSEGQEEKFRHFQQALKERKRGPKSSR